MQHGWVAWVGPASEGGLMRFKLKFFSQSVPAVRGPGLVGRWAQGNRLVRGGRTAEGSRAVATKRVTREDLWQLLLFQHVLASVLPSSHLLTGCGPGG